MSNLLSEEEVQDLTGRKYPSRQADWLRKQGIRYYINAAGRVKVPTAALTEPHTHQMGRTEPNFKGLHGAAK